MPRQLRHWKPKTKLPLPNPGEEFFEMEAWQSAGYTLAVWQRETTINQARVMVHYFEKAMREAYVSEAMEKKHKGGREFDKGNLPGLMAAMGI